MTKREALLKKISTYQFAALDLQLYLNTHPGDDAALSKVERYKEMAEPLVKQYEETYGPLTKNANDANTWAWVKGPWPWESEEDC